MVAGHDIGGGVAQHLMLANKVEVQRLAVVNGVMYELMADPRRCPIPGSSCGRRNDKGRCSRRA